MPGFNKFRGTTALVALFILAAPHAMAQDNSNSESATSESSQSSGSNLTDVVNDAPAPATDGNYQMQGTGQAGSAQGNTPGDTVVAPGDMNIQSGMTDQNAGQTVMLDIEAFAQQIYERGFRQGYVSGVSDTRQQVMEQVRAQRMQQMQQMQDDGSNMQGGQSSTGNQPAADTGSGSAPDQSERTAQEPNDEPISGEVAARPGGSIIVLPPGVSPEAFINQIMRQNQQ